jgi:hypothetical protein
METFFRVAFYFQWLPVALLCVASFAKLRGGRSASAALQVTGTVLWVLSILPELWPLQTLFDFKPHAIQVKILIQTIFTFLGGALFAIGYATETWRRNRANGVSRSK